MPRGSRSSPSSRPTCWCRRPRTRTIVQLQEQGYPTYVTSPGYSLTNAVITTSGSIGQVNVVGTQLNSEIKTGFDYPVVRGRTGGDPASQPDQGAQAQGDLVNSDRVGDASVPRTTITTSSTGTAGPGKITASRSRARRYDTGGTTGLGNTGAGVFARVVRALRPRRMNAEG